MKKTTRRNFLTGAIGATLAGIGAGLIIKELHPLTFLEKLIDNSPFEYTGKQTTKGYDIFRIKDIPDALSQRNKSEISDLFDQWDAKKGDNYANTGYSNIRTIDGELVVVADPIYEKEPEIKKIRKSSSKPYTKVDRDNVQIKSDLKKNKYDSRFLDKVDEICAELDMSAMGLMAVMCYETIHTFNPHIVNKDSGAIGLIQILPAHASEYGTTAEKLLTMTAIEQLDVVKAFFKKKEQYHKKEIDFSRPHNIALTVFYPDALHNPNASIGKKGSSNYEQNAHLDNEKKGYITGKDYVQNYLKSGQYLVK